ncbi:MAG: polymer-forming cytoskeletal protein [Bacteroidetes bacterium]|nr:polymer-forming cytoskeletal protein [Bacteroidota bacterium]
MIKDLNLIAALSKFQGNLNTQGNVRVDGQFIGDINATENITIGINGEIQGNIKGKNIFVSGKIIGDVIAKEKIVFEGKSLIRGDIKATTLIIDEGATFDGKISMTDNKSQTNPK